MIVLGFADRRTVVVARSSGGIPLHSDAHNRNRRNRARTWNSMIFMIYDSYYRSLRSFLANNKSNNRKTGEIFWGLGTPVPFYLDLRVEFLK
jgi:hypothetical protein